MTSQYNGSIIIMFFILFCDILPIWLFECKELVLLMAEIRVRFAPSPTGELHIGGARTALFNWLFAKRYGGKFILRVEDTDTVRSTGKSIENIIKAMDWLGLQWDEGPNVQGDYGPYFQSERLSFYNKAVLKMLESGAAYKCYCTPEELATEREACRKAGQPPRYSKKCRDLSLKEQQRFEEQGLKPVIRLKIPNEGVTLVKDLIRGEVSFENSVLDDFIIVKSNGYPTYNFACVVDDYMMKVSHVIRAEEHLSNTPKQVKIYEALGYKIPEFAHVPMILAPDRSKLSKRHGATSVEEFKEMGYLPEAIINYIALLGWSPGDEEIMPLSQMAEQFSLDKVSKNAAIYDVKKLTWINGHYIREIDLDRLTGMLLSYMDKKSLISREMNRDYLKKAVNITRDRAKTLEELADGISYFLNEVTEYDPKGVSKHFMRSGVVENLNKCIEVLDKLDTFTLENTENAYRALAETLEVKPAQIIHPTRLAISGRTVGPGLFDIMVLLGKTRTIERLNRAIEYLKNRA
jgi:nondiscriminating glutamyl-tRNA synthetase